MRESIRDDMQPVGEAYEPKAERPQPAEIRGAVDVLSIDFLEEMIASLTEAMGPMASMVVWDQVAALGEKYDAFPKARLRELVESASQEILEESVRIRFQQVMSAGMKD
jgi:hypothetical protein